MISSARASLFLLAVVALVAVAVIAGCAKDGIKEKEEAKSGFEMSCRLNGFSWITKLPQEGGIALAEKPCLGCTVDADNHFCSEGDYGELVAALADFRDSCKANGDTWMLMEPTKDNVAVSERMCWGCMADSQNHFCSKGEYLRFESGGSG
ncbi:hypothetical protein HYU16_05495 [Candidatus Woesearchaeota archaeon]|nr:hypothetical protein [Candidatus Woesearchaeota archaeon]